MTVTPAVAAYLPTYSVRQPYLTVAELNALPTGVDLSALVPRGDVNANTAAAVQLIASASGYVNRICNQILAATTDLVQGEYRVQRDGTIRVPVDYTPLVAVTAVSYGPAVGVLTAMTDLSGLWIEEKVVRVPVTFLTTPPSASSLAAFAKPGSLFAQMWYENGYANTTITGSVSAAGTSLTVASPCGIYPGLQMLIPDGAKTEEVTVAQSYTPGSTTVPLAAPLGFAHTAPCAVSSLPPEVKQATGMICAHLVKTRGAEGMVLASVSGGPAGQKKSPAGSGDEYDAAVDLLQPFMRVR